MHFTYSAEVLFPDRQSLVLKKYEGIKLEIYLGAFAQGYLDAISGTGGACPLFNGEYGNIRTKGYGHGSVYATLKNLANEDVNKFNQLTARLDSQIVETYADDK